MALLSAGTTKLPKELQERIYRGRQRLEEVAPYRDEAWEFYRGNHYVYVDERNLLQALSTATSVRGTGKPRWRARTTRNLIFDAVLHEAAALSQRVPSYQVVPSTGDPDDISAARLAEKVALFGHGKWNLRQVAVDALIHAIVGGEAFAWTYFDTSTGPFIDDGEGNLIGQGDVKVHVYGSNECYWEPGLRFDRSQWHVVEQARPVSQVEAMEGYLGGSLSPDAYTRQLSFRGRRESDKSKLVLVSEYLERPGPNNPDGLWMTMANNRRIAEDRPYPGTGEDPCLRKLSYAPDPDSDRDLGLVVQLLDAQRTHNDANNKAVEWKNLVLMPRIVVTPGLLKKQRWTDEPGKVYEIPQPEQNFKVVDTPTVPSELFEMMDRAERDLGRIAAQNDIPSQVESGKGIQALIEKDDTRRGAFTASLADFHSKVMHDCLVQVQAHYTEPRLLQVKGDFGWESVKDFQGAQLRDQVDIRVMPESIEPRTKQAVEQRVMNYAQMGWIGPDQAMTAIEQGTADSVVRSLMVDEARAGRIIQRIKEGPDALFSMPMLPTGRMEKIPDPSGAIDPMTGQPVMVETGQPEMAPGWMPRYSDNLPVFRNMFESWMKTEEFERLEPELQQAAAQIYAGILQLEAEKAAEQQAAQAAQAEQYGMANASKPGQKPQSSLPSLSGASRDNGQAG